MGQVIYYLHDGRPARVTERGIAVPRAEYLTRDGEWIEADPWKVTVDGRRIPENLALRFGRLHPPKDTPQPSKPNR